MFYQNAYLSIDPMYGSDNCVEPTIGIVDGNRNSPSWRAISEGFKFVSKNDGSINTQQRKISLLVISIPVRELSQEYS